MSLNASPRVIDRQGQRDVASTANAFLHAMSTFLELAERAIHANAPPYEHPAAKRFMHSAACLEFADAVAEVEATRILALIQSGVTDVDLDGPASG